MNLTAIFSSVLALTITGSILSAVIILAKLLFRNKFSAKWNYYIWVLLLFRLVIPYNPPQAFNLSDLMSIENTNPANYQKKVQSSITSSSDTDIFMPAEKIPVSESSGNDSIVESVAGSTKLNNKTEKPERLELNYNLFGLIWAAGAAIFLLLALSINIRMHIIIKKGVLCTDNKIINTFDCCRLKMHVNKNIPIIIDSLKRSPFLFGVVNPKLLISSEVLKNMSSEDLQYIFLHELTHYRRKDILMFWIITFIQALHWFNPVIWYAFRCIRQDSEILCDWMVLGKISTKESKNYGQTIINLVKTISYSRPIPGATGIVSNSQVKRRIIMISKTGKKSTRVTILSFMTVLIISIFSLQLGCTVNGGKKPAFVQPVQTDSLPQSTVKPTDIKNNVLSEYNKLVEKNSKLGEIAKFLNDNIASAPKADATSMVIKFEEAQKKQLPELEKRYYNGSTIQGKMQAAYKPDFDINKLDDIKDDAIKSLLTETKEGGFKVETAEGTFFPVINYDFYKKFSSFVTDDIKDYIDIMAVESDKVPAKDAALMITWDEIIKRALKQEGFLSKYANSIKAKDIKILYNNYVIYTLFGLNNTPLFDYEKNQMDPEAKATYSKAIAENINSGSFIKLLKDYFDVIEKNGFKLTDEVANFRKNNR